MAIRRRPQLVISFATTTAAMAAEAYFKEQGLPGRIIPLPREVSAGCGLSWKADLADEVKLTEALDAAGIAFSGVHHVTI